MKVKSIIASGLLLLGVGAATTSCEDMFTAENKLVTTDLAPQDTVYQMMGIVKRMQKLADRTVLLGEIRADLVDVNRSVASKDVQELWDNAVTADNAYNTPADYYDVINNCNIYLTHVDSLLRSHGEYYYEKEICAAKCFRAWCYLELVKVYGEVPLVFDEPIVTADAAEEIVSSGVKADINTILSRCIDDLQKYPTMKKNNELRPTYGGNTWRDVTFANFFIPVRVLLAELYLWRGSYTGSQSDYVNAIRLYHDYLTYPGEEHNVSDSYTAEWSRFQRDHMGEPSYDYYGSDHFELVNYTSRDADQAGIIPCDTSTYYGTTSDLRKVFNSQFTNNYYPWVTPSQRIRDISAAQDYCYYNYTSATVQDIQIFPKNPNEYDDPLYVGDLRLYSVYKTENNTSKEARDNANLNSVKSCITKWNNGSNSPSEAKNYYVPYYRNTIIYLHLAEALNRAGFPETAFAILKYGLTYQVLESRSIISQDEFDRLCKIPTYIDIEETDDDADPKSKNTVAVWPSTVFENPFDQLASGTSIVITKLQQTGIHSLGSGRTKYNYQYELDDDETLTTLDENWPLYMPTMPTYSRTEDPDSVIYKAALAQYAEDVDVYLTNYEYRTKYLASSEIRAKRQDKVSKLILEEEALEGMFEGLRFYDLMRYQMQEGKFTSNAITMPSYIEEKYGSTRISGKPWYLNLPQR